jgi:hypothetical protein
MTQDDIEAKFKGMIDGVQRQQQTRISTLFGLKKK